MQGSKLQKKVWTSEDFPKKSLISAVASEKWSSKKRYFTSTNCGLFSHDKVLSFFWFIHFIEARFGSLSYIWKKWRVEKYLLIFPDLYVLGSSSIWTCQILNICYCFLQAGTFKKPKQILKFDTFKSMCYQGHRMSRKSKYQLAFKKVNKLKHLIWKMLSTTFGHRLKSLRYA